LDLTPSRPLRLLHVIVSLGIGGAERLVVSAATRLPRGEFESVICCLAEPGLLAGEAQRAGVRVVCVGDFPGVRHPLAFARLVRLIRAERPDVVHTHLQAANLYGRCAALIAGAPAIVATEHNVYASKAARYVAVERWLARRSDALVAVSEEVRRFLASQLALDASAIRVIHNGIAPAMPTERGLAALRQRLAFVGGRPLIGVVASLTAKKGHEHLLRALAALRDRGVGCVAVFAGDGPERSRLQSMAATLGLANDVLFLGNWRPAAEVFALLDVFVLPSVVEGLPLALLEAMAAGVPVVATTVGGVPEVIAHGVNGLLVPPASPPALADAIASLAGSAALRQQLRERGRATVAAGFTEERYLAALAALYRELSPRR